MSVPDPSWDDNRKRIREYWPSAQFGAENEPNELRDLWYRTLRNLNQFFLSVALQDVKLNFASHQPELKWVHAAYDRIVESRRNKPSGATPPADRHFVDFEERSRFGPWTVNYSASFATVEEAQRLAQSNGGRVRSLRSGFGETQGQSFADSDARVTAHLKTHSRETIASAIARLRDTGMLSPTPLVGGVDNWPRTVRSLVWSRLDIDAATPQKAAST